jgi:putative hemolysin
MPFVFVVNGLARFFVGLLGIDPLEKGKFVTEEELKTLINIGKEEGVLEEDEQKMLTGVFDLGETLAREIMTPRADMVCVELHTSLSEIIKMVSDNGHSRIPIYQERRDNILGILYAKDLLKVTQGMETNLRNLLRPVEFVPETKKIDELLKKMKAKRTHIAMVVDEHGGVTGLVTIEDILEEIVGEIEDEFDVEPPSLRTLSENAYLIDAGINVYDLNERLRLGIPEGEDYDTLGGFVVHLLGEIPRTGDSVSHENLTFEVTQAERKRVLEVKLTVASISDSTENKELSDN